MMNEIMVVIDGPEPLNLNRLVLRVFLILVPDREPTFFASSTSNVDVRLGNSGHVRLNWFAEVDHFCVL